MARYLWQVSYTTEGVKGLAKEGGAGRRQMVENMVGGLGGSLEAFYFGFGDVDVYCIVDLPDNASAAAASITASASGAASVKTVVLLTPEEIDEASKKSVDYRAPGA